MKKWKGFPLSVRRPESSAKVDGGGQERALARGQAARVQLALVSRHPVWAIREDAWQSHLQTMGDTTLAFWWDDDEDDEESPTDYELTAEGVAIIRIQGMLIDSEPTWWMSYLGYCSTPAIARMVRAAAADANVKKVLLHIKCPGGHFTGLADAADAIYEVRQAGQKEIVAFCKDACSAAYWLASQTSRIWATQDGDIGCIGTLIAVRDSSKAYELMGVAVDRITSDGAEEIKGMMTPGTEITDTQKADLKRIANESQALFNAGIQRGRGLSATDTTALATGRWYIGANALALGLVDRILTEAEALTLLGSGADLDADPTPAPPSPESDPAPTTNNARSIHTITQTAAQSGKEQKKPMTWEQFAAALGIGTGNADPAQNAAPSTTTPNPAAIPPAPAPATAATTAESPELIRLREFEQKTLGAKRTAAKAAAVTAFGQGSDKLARAERSIDALSDPDAIDDLAQLYADQTPAALQGDGNGRRTQGATLPSGEEGQAMSLLASVRKTGTEGGEDDDIKQLRLTARRVSGAPANTSSNGSNGRTN